MDRTLAVLQKERDIQKLHRRFAFLGRLAFLVMRSRNRLLLSNLRIVLPEETESRRRMIAGKISHHIIRGFADVA